MKGYLFTIGFVLLPILLFLENDKEYYLVDTTSLFLSLRSFLWKVQYKSHQIRIMKLFWMSYSSYTLFLVCSFHLVGNGKNNWIGLGIKEEHKKLKLDIVKIWHLLLSLFIVPLEKRLKLTKWTNAGFKRGVSTDRRIKF